MDENTKEIDPIQVESVEPVLEVPNEETSPVTLPEEAEPITDTTTVSDSIPVPVSPPVTPVITEQPEETPSASVQDSSEAKPVVSPPVVFSSPPAPLSTLDRISLAFKNNMMHARELLVKAHAVVSTRRRKKIDSIMTLFLIKKKIKNSDVRDLLHITDETATVYLNILKKEGKIQQNGKGGWVYYTRVS